MSVQKSVGIMDGAYFVGRKELLRWVNDVLHTTYSQIGDLCTGTAYCQILDAAYPDVVPLHRVNFHCKYDYEYVKNFKLLQWVFRKVGIDKCVPVDLLVRGKTQDNLEFLQWLKRQVGEISSDYDAVAARKAALKRQAEMAKSTRTQINNTNNRNTNNAQKVAQKPSKAAEVSENSAENGSAAAPISKPISSLGNLSGLKPKKNEVAAAPPPSPPSSTEIAELKVTLAALEKERDFYFAKLRDFEALFSEYEESHPEVIAVFQECMYAGQ